jgi:6-phosphogluconolactonase (cycloisomerase 2 family)
MPVVPCRLGTTIATAVAAAAILAVSAPSAPAADSAATRHADAGHAVFAQTNNLSGNQIIAYHRDRQGRLTQAGTYDTGGRGGQLTGSVADHLASQGSLTYDSEHGLLFAVNAGSNTVSVFRVDGDRLRLRQVVGSGGRFPVSVAVHDHVVYVLNALDGGSIQGYKLDGDHLEKKDGWHRCLGLDPNATPQFTNTPGQVGFVRGGSQLVVTTKANGNNLDVFAIDHRGAPSGSPVVTNLPGAVPFGFVPNDRRGIFLTEAGPNALATFDIHRDGSARQVAFAATGQAATCWVVAIGDLLYTSNAGSATISGFRASDGGRHLTALGYASTDPGTIDAAASSDGRFLYVQTGVNGIIDEFTVNHDGTLTQFGTAAIPDGAGSEGIAAS